MAGAITSFKITPLLRRTTVIQTFRFPLRLDNNHFYQRKVQFLSNPANFSSVAGLCHLVHASKGDSSEVLIKGVVDKNVLEDVRRVLDMAKRASSRREIVHTDFLTPPVLKESMHALEKLADVKAVAQGGYPQAERCRLSVGHSEAMTTTPDIVDALSVTGNFGLQPCSHSDFLGAILGTGIAREKLGDILLQVGNVPVTCTRIPLLALEYAPPRTKTFKTIEASLRLDAVASAGYKISRSKLVDLIR
ncbi:hypothetical protein C5167_039487 [Papaver somniferum]|uniref:Uncharacterized protein n=1 Tax=Papaver somniferum TaxID=3469 RepID=A0A4Y7IC88_PAPSO|nr:hypothetical protein C5167_039487 [Papaver somniferum]